MPGQEDMIKVLNLQENTYNGQKHRVGWYDRPSRVADLAVRSSRKVVVRAH